RLGAALAAPRLAMEHAERRDGHAPADLAILVLVGFTATHLEHLVRAGWLVADGDGMGAFAAVGTPLGAALPAVILFGLAGGLVVTGLAGRRRAIASDFDLACVAAVPIGATAIAGALAARAGLWPHWLDASWLGLAWSAGLITLAVRTARGRPEAPPPAEAP